MLELTLDRARKQSLYSQISEQIKTLIGSGRLPANSRLPTVRQLAHDLGVTRLTIQNAYSQLQADGWIEATVGRGTIVSPAVQPMSLQPSIGQYLTPDSALNDMLEINQVVGVRSMAMAHPDPSLFPTVEFWSFLDRLRPQAQHFFSYGPIQGDPELRIEITRLAREAGIDTFPDDIMITAGTMQGISLAAQALARPGDKVLVDEPTFLGTLNILKAQKLDWISIPVSEKGPNLETLEITLKTHRPRFFYVNPTFHNPTGVCFPLATRLGILELAAKYNCAIIEDDIYAPLAYDQAPPPPLKALNSEAAVIYLGGFSKMLMPGLRVGYLIMPPGLRNPLLTLRRSTDLCNSGLFQRALANYLSDGGLKRHLKRVVPIYRERRNALLSSLQREMPAEVQWSRPQGGFCTWLTFPRQASTSDLYRHALQNGFAFTPGEAYLIDNPLHEHLRLCFGNQTITGIDSGISLLSQLIREHLQNGSHTADWLPLV